MKCIYLVRFHPNHDFLFCITELLKNVAVVLCDSWSFPIRTQRKSLEKKMFWQRRIFLSCRITKTYIKCTYKFLVTEDHSCCKPHTVCNCDNELWVLYYCMLYIVCCTLYVVWVIGFNLNIESSNSTIKYIIKTLWQQLSDTSILVHLKTNSL